jgi:hypothetical protein
VRGAGRHSAAACLLQIDLAAPFCGDEPLARKVDARLRAKLGGAEKLLANAGSKSGKALSGPLPLHGPCLSDHISTPVNPVDHIVDSMPGALVVGVVVVVVSKAIAP